ncbi:MAG: exo-beta-N-acetylmuramidase NamZ family protein [Fimbriimonadales bacterium]
MTLAGLDVLSRTNFAQLKGKRIGVLCNQGSIARDYRHILDLLLEQPDIQIQAVFGPQHGPFGHQQDNMIEWEGRIDPRTGLRVHSLYGERREPTAEMLQGIDELVIDLQDVGARYYTFVSTMKACLGALKSYGIAATVLDRPNPISGSQTEGPMLEDGFESFVGAYPVPARHGMTIGELARRFHADAKVIPLEGWERDMYFEQTDLPWAMPSPNMPTPDTAVVYPGACLLEATNLSEGRGTTRPFEIFGAPFLDAWRFADAMNAMRLEGCIFRPIEFEPTFNKHAGKVCGGCFLHVTDRTTFEPVLTYCAVMQEAIRQTGLHVAEGPTDERFKPDSTETRLPGFAWRRPPYEYVTDRRPIDVLAGNSWLAAEIENETPLAKLRARLKARMP